VATYGGQSVARQRNGMAVAGFVCAFIGIFLFNFILGPLGIIFGGVGLSRARDGAPNRGLAIAGVVLGIIDLVLFLVLVVAVAHHGGRTYWRI
jgi:Domain of unknown function (DUF4190)